MPTHTASAGMPPRLPYPVSPNYQCGEFRGWTLKQKTVLTRELGYFTGWDEEPPGHFIENQGNVWMSTSRFERESHAIHLKYARGTVVVCGVGMGMYLFNIAALPAVDRIIAVDRDAAVIDLLERGAGLEDWPGRDKITFVQRDALRLTADDLGPTTVDYLYVDIWPELCDPNAMSDTQAIQRAVGAKNVGWWGQELDFIEWLFQHRPQNHVPDVEDLQAFIEETGLPTGEPSAAYVDCCVQAGQVYAEYGGLPFAVAKRDRATAQSPASQAI